MDCRSLTEIYRSFAPFFDSSLDCMVVVFHFDTIASVVVFVF